MTILDSIKFKAELLKYKGKYSNISLDVDINNLPSWVIKREDGKLEASLNFLIKYAISNHLEALEIPDCIEVLRIEDDYARYKNLIVFPESLLGFVFHDDIKYHVCEFNYPHLDCSKLCFKKCKSLNVVESYSFSQLYLDYLELPSHIHIKENAFVNSHIDTLSFNGITYLHTGSLVQLDVNYLDNVSVVSGGSIEEDSCGKHVKSVYLPVNKQLYMKEFQAFLDGCRKSVCKNRFKYTSEERKSVIELFEYCLNNPYLFDEDEVETQELPIVDMEIKINVKEINLNRYGNLLAIWQYIYAKKIEITKENYLKQMLYCVSKLFWFSDDYIEHNVYLYNTESTTADYKYIYSSKVTNRGKVTIYMDKTLVDEFESKFEKG